MPLFCVPAITDFTATQAAQKIQMNFESHTSNFTATQAAQKTIILIIFTFDNLHRHIGGLEICRAWAVSCTNSSPPHRRLRKHRSSTACRVFVFTATQAAQKNYGNLPKDALIFTATQAAQKFNALNGKLAHLFTATQAAQKFSVKGVSFIQKFTATQAAQKCTCNTRWLQNKFTATQAAQKNTWCNNPITY